MLRSTPTCQTITHQLSCSMADLRNAAVFSPDVRPYSSKTLELLLNATTLLAFQLKNWSRFGTTAITSQYQHNKTRTRWSTMLVACNPTCRWHAADNQSMHTKHRVRSLQTATTWAVIGDRRRYWASLPNDVTVHRPVFCCGLMIQPRRPDQPSGRVQRSAVLLASMPRHIGSCFGRSINVMVPSASNSRKSAPQGAFAWVTPVDGSAGILLLKFDCGTTFAP